MMRRKLLHRIEGCGATGHMMTDVTSCMMTVVGGETSSTMKVCGATESILINSIK